MNMDTYQQAIRRAIELAPGTIRELGRNAGIDQSWLIRIRQGEKSPSDVQMEKVFMALADYADRSARAAQIIREALDGGKQDVATMGKGRDGRRG